MNEAMTLYQRKWCPYCVKVRRAADRLGIELRLVDIGREPAARDMLIAARGRATVPVLEIPGEDGSTLMPESADIVAFLDDLARRTSATESSQ